MKKAFLKNKNNKIKKIGIIIIIVSIFLMSLGYSAFRKDLTISNVAGVIEASLNTKINSVLVNSSSDDDSYSNSSSYDNGEFFANIVLNNNDSWVKYEISVVNIGNTQMGIANILEQNLSEDITYEIEGYNLKEPICDNNIINKCTLNATKTFYITFKYKDGVVGGSSSSFAINIKFDFEEFYNVIYSSNICVGCKSYAIKNASFSTTLVNYNKISVKVNGISLIDGYTFDNNTGVLTIDNVNGDISIINTTYTRLEYIQSTGTTDNQYINIDYTPNKNTTAVYDGMVVDGDTALYGVREATNRVQRFTMQYVSSGKYRGSYKNADFEISSTYAKNVRHIFKMDGNNIYIDNVLVKSITAGLIDKFQALDTLFVFAINTGGVASNFGIVRLYSFKIYENDVLVKNYIPVLDSDDIPCLYETIGKTYYYKSGSGTLNYQELSQYTITNNISGISSSDKQTYVLLGDKYDTILSKTNGNTLPTAIRITSSGIPLIKNTDYTYDPLTGRLIINEVTGNIVISEVASTKLDYIESTGKQYINTEHNAGVNTKVVFTHIPQVARFSSWVSYFGYRNGDTNNDSFYVSSGSSSNISVVSSFFGGVHMANDTNTPFTHVVGSTEVISLSNDEFSITVDGIKKLSVTKLSDTEISINNNGDISIVTMSSTNPVFNTTGPIFIFGRNISNNTFNYGAPIRLLSFQIYEGNELVMDLEPIKDENDNIGLVDNISKEYFYNQGTESFASPT